MERISADEVRALRTRLGLTQAELGAKLGGLSKDTVRGWESGKRPCKGAYALLLRGLA